LKASSGLIGGGAETLLLEIGEIMILFSFVYGVGDVRKQLRWSCLAARQAALCALNAGAIWAHPHDVHTFASAVGGWLRTPG
jgi:hypothetical protein